MRTVGSARAEARDVVRIDRSAPLGSRVVRSDSRQHHSDLGDGAPPVLRAQRLEIEYAHDVVHHVLLGFRTRPGVGCQAGRPDAAEPADALDDAEHGRRVMISDGCGQLDPFDTGLGRCVAHRLSHPAWQGAP